MSTRDEGLRWNGEEQACIPFAKYGNTDLFGRVWPAEYIVCSFCGQPDDCGDCNHNKLPDSEVQEILAAD